MDSPGVFALTVYGDQLIAGGEFAFAGSVPAEKIAAWDGSAWSPLGTGFGVHVSALTVASGRLITGGLFTSAGGVACNHIAAWDGTSWSPLGSGIGGTGYNTGVYALTVFNGYLMAGGWFNAAGGYPAAAIAAWGD
jgi:hypothetical protein